VARHSDFSGPQKHLGKIIKSESSSNFASNLNLDLLLLPFDSSNAEVSNLFTISYHLGHPVLSTRTTAPDLDGGGPGAQAWWEAPQNL